MAKFTDEEASSERSDCVSIHCASYRNPVDVRARFRMRYSNCSCGWRGMRCDEEACIAPLQNRMRARVRGRGPEHQPVQESIQGSPACQVLGRHSADCLERWSWARVTVGSTAVGSSPAVGCGRRGDFCSATQPKPDVWFPNNNILRSWIAVGRTETSRENTVSHGGAYLVRCDLTQRSGRRQSAGTVSAVKFTTRKALRLAGQSSFAQDPATGIVMGKNSHLPQAARDPCVFPKPPR